MPDSQPDARRGSVSHGTFYVVVFTMVLALAGLSFLMAREIMSLSRELSFVQTNLTLRMDQIEHRLEKLTARDVEHD